MQEDFKNWIGRQVERHDVVTERLAGQFKATLAPHHFRQECLPGLHWCIAVAAHEAAQLGSDGAEAKGIFLPPVPLPRRMWAGGHIESVKPFQIGDEVQRLSRVSDVKWRDGKAGRMCIVSVTHEFSVRHSLLLRERHDILFREGGIAARPQPTLLPPQDLQWNVDATQLMLFRFSAVTFNGHRIHYDLPYARHEEGYDGLLVHGPLQAALALNQLSVLEGRVPRNFSYRCVAPLVAGHKFHVFSRRDEADQFATVTDAAGVVTLLAEAHS